MILINYMFSAFILLEKTSFNVDNNKVWKIFGN